jgi:hypothetical protein
VSLVSQKSLKASRIKGWVSINSAIGTQALDVSWTEYSSSDMPTLRWKNTSQCYMTDSRSNMPSGQCSCQHSLLWVYPVSLHLKQWSWYLLRWLVLPPGLGNAPTSIRIWPSWKIPSQWPEVMLCLDGAFQCSRTVNSLSYVSIFPLTVKSECRTESILWSFHLLAIT